MVVACDKTMSKSSKGSSHSLSSSQQDREAQPRDPVERKNISVRRSLLKDFEDYAARQRRPFSTQLSILMEAALRNEDDVIDTEIVKLRSANPDYISIDEMWQEVEQ